jgi:hypothetical protein
MGAGRKALPSRILAIAPSTPALKGSEGELAVNS